MKVISWNLLRLSGAAVEDIAALIERQRPDLLLMQEVTSDIDILPALAGGYLHRVPLPGRIHGLAAWSPRFLPKPQALLLPISPMPGGLPPRIAQIVRHGDITFANVHLSHGQFLNRRQLMYVASLLEGPSAVIGDFNAVGPVLLRGFRDVGPRQPTHLASNVLPFRLDRCLISGLHCDRAKALERGPSDHCPILLDLVATHDVDQDRRMRPPWRRRLIAERIRRLRDRRQQGSRPKVTASKAAISRLVVFEAGRSVFKRRRQIPPLRSDSKFDLLLVESAASACRA